MTIKVGDKLPAGVLKEFIEVEGHGCTVGPNDFQMQDVTKGKKVVIFGLPGAFTPTCSAKHVPGYVEKFDRLKGRKVDEIWCVAVNDAFVMAHWGREQKALGKIRFLGDGSALGTRALGLDIDRTSPP